MTLRTPKQYLPEPPAERMAAARALFESIPLSTPETVAAEAGVAPYWVRRWRREGDWKKAIRALPDLSARAGQLADNFKTKMSDLGKPLDDATASREVSADLATDFAVDVRAQVLDRHRKEWAAPRAIAYKAIKEAEQDVAKGFERAKLAKITSETLTLIQGGECRAYGINHDARAGDGQTVVVVERGGQAPAPAAQPTGTDLVAAAGGMAPEGDGEDAF
jgi:hypothetical protein